jgi:hypothetical protein
MPEHFSLEPQTYVGQHPYTASAIFAIVDLRQKTEALDLPTQHAHDIDFAAFSPNSVTLVLLPINTVVVRRENRVNSRKPSSPHLRSQFPFRAQASAHRK